MSVPVPVGSSDTFSHEKSYSGIFFLGIITSKKYIICLYGFLILSSKKTIPTCVSTLDYLILLRLRGMQAPQKYCFSMFHNSVGEQKVSKCLSASSMICDWEYAYSGL